MPRHPFRIASDCAPGAPVFLTICTSHRRLLFRDSGRVAAVVTELVRCGREHGCHVLGYCVMPDHLHAIVGPRPEGRGLHLLGRSPGPSGPGNTVPGDIARFVKLFKQRTAYAFRRTDDAALWQASYFDRTLRADEALAPVMRYMIENPVRARLVTSPGEYPF